MTAASIWGADVLWEKTKLYVARAASEEQEGALFPFWSILALELLARTVVGSVHPVASPLVVYEPVEVFSAAAAGSGDS